MWWVRFRSRRDHDFLGRNTRREITRVGIPLPPCLLVMGVGSGAGDSRWHIAHPFDRATYLLHEKRSEGARDLHAAWCVSLRHGPTRRAGALACASPCFMFWRPLGWVDVLGAFSFRRFCVSGAGPKTELNVWFSTGNHV